MTSRTAARTCKGFTLLELIVVIVILGLLAALAIPTFARVTKRTQDSVTAATAAAVLRDARALMAFGDGMTWPEAVTTATNETPSASTAGLVAASTLTAVAEKGAEPKADRTEAVYAFGDLVGIERDFVVVSLRSASGNVCVGAASLMAATTPVCVPALTSGSSAAAVKNGSALSDGTLVTLPGGSAPSGPVTTPPVTTVPATPPSAPSAVTVVPGAISANVTWVASTATSAAVKGYTVTATPTTGAPVTVSAPAGASTATLTGLKSATTYTVTVVAASDAGASAASAPVTATTSAGVATKFAASGLRNLYQMTSDGTNLYVAAMGEAAVYKVNIATKATTKLASINNASGVAYVKGQLYVMNQSSPNLYRVDPSTGATTTLLTGLAPFMGSMSTDGTNLYFTTSTTGTVRKVTLNANGTATDNGTVVTGVATETWMLTADADGTLYYGGNDGKIYKRSPGAAASLVATVNAGRSPFHTSLVRSGNDLWVAAYGNKEIVRVDITTGATTTYATGIAGVGIFVDGGDVYSSDYSGGGIYKLN